MPNTPKELERDDDAEVLSVYTDRQGVEDGFLVAVSGPGGVNRVTRAVHDYYVKAIGDPRFQVWNITPLMDAIRAMLAIKPDDGWRVGDYAGKRLWLIPNEVGGLTLMFPEDY
jgi:hypothetical protein